MVDDDSEANGASVVLLAEVAHKNEIAERFRHLLTIHANHGLVHPVPHEGLAGCGLGLGRFALVLGEDQIAAAAVEVDRGVEFTHGERRTLDVPARSSGSPQRFPRRLALGRGLPQHEVQWVPLVGIIDVAASFSGVRQHRLAVVPRDLAESGKRADVEVHGAAGFVGVSSIEDHPDETSDVGDGGCGPGFAPAGEHLERQHVVVEPGGLGCCQIEIVHADLARLAEQIVIDIGHITNAASLVASVPKSTLKHVVADVRGGVPQMRGVIRRDPAGVDQHQRSRFERHDLTAGRVVQAHRFRTHGAEVSQTARDPGSCETRNRSAPVGV